MNFNTVNIQELQLSHTIEINGANGSATAQIQIPVSDGRQGFHPTLSLQYGSGGTNSIFGRGWNLSGLPFISIYTRKGLPRYDGSDQFAFNGALVLEPVLNTLNGRQVHKTNEQPDHWVYYYQPQQEGLFVRIEKWVHKTTQDVHWRTRSQENVLSIYGKDSSSRIVHPEHPTQIFTWMLQEQYDANGNAIRYQYISENADNVNVLACFEKSRINRSLQYGFAQKYLSRIFYGNSKPVLPDTAVPADNTWLFEVVLDYGEMENRPYTTSSAPANAKWPGRPDPFSYGHAGFDVRTYRLCRRLLCYHHIAELAPTSLVGIFECNYAEHARGTLLNSVQYTGIRRDLTTGAYSESAMPLLSFAYTEPQPSRVFNAIVKETGENLPFGFNQVSTRFTDLFSEGLPGLLTEAANNWYYKPNLGGGVFGKQEIIIQKPSALNGIYSLGDFDLDGNINLYSLQGRMAGYYEYDRDLDRWSGFHPFPSIPQVSHSRLIDINADGFPDLLVEQDDKIICYPFKGKEGFDNPIAFAKPESVGTANAPTVIDNMVLDYFLADMTGDGLADQVRIKNGRVEYYPNLGNGHFGEAVLMEGSPVIDFDTAFDASRVRLYDLDGTGTSDLIYIGNGEIRYWYNGAGNTFTEGGRITNLPYIDNISSAVILDFLGNGTPCLVWSNSLQHAQYASVHYLELTNGVTPGLMISMQNGLGRETRIRYGHSASHYLRCRAEGKPWISKIPGHFIVADSKEIIDHITQSRHVLEYRYRDGQYDGSERSFVTFGLVEEYDTELFPQQNIPHDATYAQPRCVKTWLHSGMFGWDSRRAQQFYNKDNKQPRLASQFFEADEALDAEDFAKGYRSLAGKMIRQEIYAADGSGTIAEHPYQVAQFKYAIRKQQPKTAFSSSCYYSYLAESLQIDYEQQAEDPRVAHHLVVKMGPYGQPELDVNIAYARRAGSPGLLPAQMQDIITATEHRYLHQDDADAYQPNTSYESREFEINRLDHLPNEVVQMSLLKTNLAAYIQLPLSPDQALPAGGATKSRLISWERTYYWNDALNAALPLGQCGNLLFAHHEETACFTTALIDQAFGGKVTPAMLSGADEGNYLFNDGYWWQSDGVHYFHPAAKFYCLDKVEAIPGNPVIHTYDSYFLHTIKVTDAIGNYTQAAIDYNLGHPYRLTDINGNISEVLYDGLGVAIASFDHGHVMDLSDTLQPYGNGQLSGYVRRNDENFSAILASPALYLQEANNFMFYDLFRWENENKPLRCLSLTRENLIHDGRGNVDNAAEIIIRLDYQDGLGRAIQSKQKVEAGLAVKRKPDQTIETDISGNPVLVHSAERWLVSGHTIYNNKQQVVRRFEPFYSSTPDLETDEALESYGVSSQIYYDAVGRTYRTDYPDNTFSELSVAPWETYYYDRNDTVDRSLYKTIRQVLPVNAPERMALDRSLEHKDTPIIHKLDALGREVQQIERNNDGTERVNTHRLNTTGATLSTQDARGLEAFTYTYDMSGKLLFMHSIDGGNAYHFHNSYNQLIHSWDGRDVHQRMRYDKLGRPVTVHVDGALGLNQITERHVYGDDAGITNAAERNLKGQLVVHYDQAGRNEIKAMTPGGKPLLQERQLTAQYLQEPDWTDPTLVAMATEVYRSTFIYDALGRALQLTLPDDTQRNYVFHKGGGLKQVLVSTGDGQLSDTLLLKDTDYDAKGLRQFAVLGNDVRQDYTYETDTFRLKRLVSAKTTGGNRLYQDINYWYDPVGNLVYLDDLAQQSAAADPKVIQGLNVSAHSEFTYDALYQLKEAKGRVHQALVKNDYADRSRENPVPAGWMKGSRHITLNNGAAIERYTRKYQYDLSGNLISLQHIGATQNFTRQIWTSALNNRSLPLLDMNDLPVANPDSRFDGNGNCIYLPHLRSIDWNYRSNISKVVVIDRSAQGKANDEEFYVYGGDGIRIRKITHRLVDVAANTLEVTEKVYINGAEIKYIVRGGVEILKRCTSTIGDGVNTIARIHSWQKDVHARETDDISKKKIHYQLHNHLGSSALELDETGDVITYEEYFPFGGTAFIAGRSTREIDMKEYRYCAKERDDFTGLYYFGYRYYAHWIGSWLSPDPIGPEDSENLYLYVHNNPVNLTDPNGLQSTRGEIHYLSPEDIAGVFAAFRASLTPERIAQLTREGRTYLHYDRTTGTVEAVTREEGLRRLEATLAAGGNVGIEATPEPPPPPPRPEDVIDTSNGPVTIEFDEMVITPEEPIVLPGDPPGNGTNGGPGGGRRNTSRHRNNGASPGNGTGRRGGNGQRSGGGVQSGDGRGGQTPGNGTGSNGTGANGTGSNGQGTQGVGPGLGQQGAGNGGGGTSPVGTGNGVTPGNGAGNGRGTGTGNRSGTGNQTPGGNGGGGNGNGGNNGGQNTGNGTNGRPGGRVGGRGNGNGQEGGRPGGSPTGVAGGQTGGRDGGSVNGDLNGSATGDPNGTVTGSPDGAAQGTDQGGTPGQGNGAGHTPNGAQGNPNGNGGGNPANQPGRQPDAGNQGQPGNGNPGGRQGPAGDPRRNLLDDITHVAGYFNLEFGSGNGTGEAGGIPGGMDLFGWRPPMWVRRTMQVLYIATTIITTVIPIGKAAIAAKVAIQGALKVGLRATMRRLLTAAAAKLPTRAGLRVALQESRAALSRGFSRVRSLFRRGPRISASGATGNPAAILRGIGDLNKRQRGLLNRLANDGDRIIIPKNGVSLNDISALTASTGVEFAMFTRRGERMLVRGTSGIVDIGVDEARSLAAQGWRWSAHTHPGRGANVLRSSVGDRAILGEFRNQSSAIMNSEGQRSIFSAAGDMLTGWLPR